MKIPSRNRHWASDVSKALEIARKRFESDTQKNPQLEVEKLYEYAARIAAEKRHPIKSKEKK